MLTGTLLITIFMICTFKFLFISTTCLHYLCHPVSKRNGKFVIVILKKVHVAVEVQLRTYLTSEVQGGGWSDSRSGHLIREESVH